MAATKKTSKKATEAHGGKKTRPTKKQHQTLEFIRHFIAEHGYSPSYREIMNGCNYTSVATVSLHVNNLIRRGHLMKRDNSARSLELTEQQLPAGSSDSIAAHIHELTREIEARFTQLEKEVEEELLNEAYVLVGALKVLGHTDLAREYATRINQLQA